MLPHAQHEDGLEVQAKVVSLERVSVDQMTFGDWPVGMRISAAGFTARRITSDEASVSRSRSFIRRTLAQWELPAQSDNALIIGGELVSNAVQHALPHIDGPQEACWIGLLQNPEHLVIAVTDPSPCPPAPFYDGDVFGERGRGLAIVNALAETWGWTPPRPEGKTVWAALRTWPARDNPAPSAP
ncbi:ATP-binding protein [[Kitasatospora] papulosa]|uniref:ATP-binding protein n=1 Tax=Streptomyces TaxID=1883 RepID=UPI003332E8FC